MFKVLLAALVLSAFLNSCKENIEVADTDTINWQKLSTRVSYLNIQSFCQDSLGYMWIATSHGLNRYNGYEFHQYYYDPEDSTSLDNDMVFALFLDSFHRLWVGTLTGVNCFDFKRNRFIRYENKQTYGSNVYSFFEDHTGNIWAATHSGPALLDTVHELILFPYTASCIVHSVWEDNSQRLWMGTNKGLALCKNHSLLEFYPLPGNKQVTSKVYIDPNGTWWLGTDAGIVCFDPVSRTFEQLPAVCLEDTRLAQSRINFIQETDRLKLIIGTESQGLFQYDIISQTLENNNPWRLNEFQSSELLCCYSDQNSNIWIGSYDKGFAVWNKSLEYFNSEYQLTKIVKDKFVTRIVEDRFGNLWLGTRYHGLYHYTPSGKVTVFNAENSELFQENNPIESLFIDSEDKIWIGLPNQLVTGSFSASGQITVSSRKGIEQVRMMKEDHSGHLWIGSWQGLIMINQGESSTSQQKRIYQGNVPDLWVLDSGEVIFSSYGEGIFRFSKGDTIPRLIAVPVKAQPAAQTCVTLFEDSRGRIWAGSYGHGMICMEEDTCLIFTKEEGLPNNNVLCFQEDQVGCLWMSTSNGISKFDQENGTFKNYSINDGTLGNQYHEKGGLTHSDGRIFFTGNHGLTFFNPMAEMPVQSPPNVILEDLKILNRSVQPRPDNSTLPMSIAYASNITLNHRQSVFSIDYSGINFISPDKLTYAYKLEGFDENWSYVGNFRRATYSNLLAGKYHFYVKAINRDGVESTRPAGIQIVIKPAPWFTWQAVAFYILAFLSAVYYLFHLILKVKMNQQLLEIEHNERLREHEISDMKINLFTNISHELRTPLTLISAPLEQLTTQNELSEPNRKLLSTITRNVASMLRLINQLLDFKIIENGIMSLQVQKSDIIKLIQSIQELYLYPSEKKRITLVFTPHTSNYCFWIDTDKLEKILHNLLSNALKHTPVNGSIQIKTNILDHSSAARKYLGIADSESDTFFEVEVTDSGPGIPESKLGELFRRYRRINGPSGLKPDYGGSGIGLHYTKHLVQNHKGQIIACNQPGGGMTFSFILPVVDIYSDNEKKLCPDIIRSDDNSELVSPDIENRIKKQYTVLLVEDNSELLEFIRNILIPHYQLLEAADGDKAWEITQNQIPDLILSDVLMPGLSGYDLCRKIKSHPELSHIPVILLTAKSTIFDQIEGLEVGADIYICKPFNVEYLLLTIKNLFNARNKLRLYYSTPQIKTQEQIPIPVKLSEYDQKMMNKLIFIMEEDLSNPEITIDYLAKDLGFSRASFYRKIKGLMDMTPIDFLRNFRLKKAAEMIQEGSFSLSDISDKTGFSSYSYFSKSFKKHYGMTPKKYQTSNMHD